MKNSRRWQNKAYYLVQGMNGLSSGAFANWRLLLPDSHGLGDVTADTGYRLGGTPASSILASFLSHMPGLCMYVWICICEALGSLAGRQCLREEGRSCLMLAGVTT
jgi:hypothetical protein